MNTLIFYFYLMIGRVIPMHEECNGIDMYVLKLKDNTVIEHAYKKEIIEYIKTGTFEYDE